MTIGDGAPGNQTQAQTQSQQQAITISVESAGDPDLERRIFSQVHSAGRQLGHLAAVVELLLTAHEAAGGTFAATPDAQAAIETFRKMQLDILRAKSLRDPDRLIRQLEALRRADGPAFATVRDRLRAWLASTDGVSTGVAPGGVSTGVAPGGVSTGVAPGGVSTGVAPGGVSTGVAPGGVSTGVAPGGVSTGVAPGGAPWPPAQL